MKRKLFSAGFIVFNAAFAFVLIVLTANALRFGRCFPAAEKIPEIDYQLLRILPYNLSDGEVSAAISILDTDGDECAVIERSWRGNFLTADFICASFSEKKLYFPKRIYGAKSLYSADFSSKKGKRGTNLFPYYNQNSFCLLIGKSRPSTERKALRTIASFAFSPAAVFVSGFVQKTSLNLTDLENGKYYGVFVEQGNLIVREE
ncbi:MAG: hypothetical protein ACTTKL_02120 [Treponema sp.]